MTKIAIPPELKLIPIENNQHYYADRKGNIYSIKKGEVLMLSQHTSDSGYLITSFGRKKHKAHRIVALTYIPNPDNLPEVNHKDLIKTNNNDWNLEWCTGEQNITHYLSSDKFKNRDLGFIPVYQIDFKGNIVKKWDSVSQTKHHGFSPACISASFMSKSHHHRGFIWVRVKDFEHISLKEKIKWALKTPGTPIYQLDLSGNIVREWKSSTEAWSSTDNDFQKAGISRCCQEKQVEHKKFKFCFKQDYEKSYEGTKV